MEAIYALRDGFDAAEDTQRAEALAKEVTAALQPDKSEPTVSEADAAYDAAWRAANAEGLSIREAQQRAVKAYEAVESRADTQE